VAHTTAPRLIFFYVTLNINARFKLSYNSISFVTENKIFRLSVELRLF